jgi:transcriptional regulator with XRE-family HTH domain
MTGDEVRAQRELRNLSQAALGKAVGVTQPAIKKIEAGDTKKSRYLADIERYFETHPVGEQQPGGPAISSSVSFDPAVLEEIVAGAMDSAISLAQQGLAPERLKDFVDLAAKNIVALAGEREADSEGILARGSARSRTRLVARAVWNSHS